MSAHYSLFRLSSALLLLAFMFVLTAGTLNVMPAHAAGILYVAPAASGAGDCSRWENACTLQIALNQSEGGDEVWVKAGIYYPGAAGERTTTFNLKTGVALYGGFAGTETARDQRDWQANLTILSGDIDGNDTDLDGNFIAETWLDIQGDNAYHVVTGWVDASTVLDGFVITAGQANGSDYDGVGGGMYNYSDATLTNITFSGNAATNWGGGIFNFNDGKPTLTNVTFTGNYANQGGGMYNGGGSPTLTEVTFTHNEADRGGGMYNNNSNPTLTNVTFSSNTANQGGGIYNYDFGIIIPQLTNVIFFQNTADEYGGGMVNEYNSAPTLTNALFVGNSADQAGAIYNHHHSSITLRNVTIAGNTTKQGGGIMNGYYSWPVLVNTVIWGNTVLNGPQIYNDGDSTANISYSDIQGCGGSDTWNTACGIDNGNNIDADPLYVDAFNGNFHLVFDSPAVDTGTSTGAPNTDLDNSPRDFLPDMGAYEYQWFRIYLTFVLRNEH